MIYFTSPNPSSSESALCQNSYYNQGFKLENNITTNNSDGGIWERLDTWLCWFLQLLWGFIQGLLLISEFINSRSSYLSTTLQSFLSLYQFSLPYHLGFGVLCSLISANSMLSAFFVFQQLFRIFPFLTAEFGLLALLWIYFPSTPPFFYIS